MISNYKVCTVCKESLPATKDYFYEQKGGKFGFKGRCKVCWKRHAAEWKKDNPDKHKSYAKKYYEKNKDWLAEYQREYRKKKGEVA